MAQAVETRKRESLGKPPGHLLRIGFSCYVFVKKKMEELMVLRFAMEVLGILLVSGLVGGGVVWLFQNIVLAEKTERYRFSDRLLEDGRVKREVIDLEEDEVEIVRAPRS